jgi:hypothetical protein
MFLFEDLATFSYIIKSKNEAFLGQKSKKIKNNPFFWSLYVTFNLKTNKKVGTFDLFCLIIFL